MKLTRNFKHIVSHKTDTTMERGWNRYPCVCFLLLFRLQDVSELMESVSVIQVSFQAFFIRYFIIQALNSVKINPL